ncbi:mutT/NUDIX family protein [Paenibacillus algicola]|uniref:MutT/NUDIX family protein n=1 Tax=Paenibacillus algicola TaxID=2565926 RepID=A0A4P8XGZ6_9BACL|nr:NUDIX domain-containing protein [Paenibacillus algicola]QCT01797.1 mutT/NUDIX family protein [Paenibacillus algicola]
MEVSVGVQAVIIENNKILTIKKRDDDSSDATYILPGGKQEFGETLEQAVCREVFEEVGIAVNVDDFLFLREFIGANHENAEANKNLQIVSPIFLCSIKSSNDIPLTPPNPDPDQIGVEWIPLNELVKLRFYPKELIPQLIKVGNGNKPSRCYVGDIN